MNIPEKSMIEFSKYRFVVGVNGFYWSAAFHDYYAFLQRQAEKAGFDMDEEPGFKLLKQVPKWLKATERWAVRDLPRGGYIEPIDYDENDFKECLDEIDTWHEVQLSYAR